MLIIRLSNGLGTKGCAQPDRVYLPMGLDEQLQIGQKRRRA